MFDFDASKFILIGIVALIFIGPKELPGVLRQVGQFVGKMRRMAAEFQGQFMEAMKEADVASLKEDMAKLKDSTRLNVDFNPLSEIRNSIQDAVTPPAPLPAPVPSVAEPAGVKLDLPPVPEAAAPVIEPPKSVTKLIAKPRKRVKMASDIDGEAPRPRKRPVKAIAPEDRQA